MTITINKNVLDNSLEVLNYVIPKYDCILVNFSGGKDSSVCLDLVEKVNKNFKKDIYLFWIDQEFEYFETYDFIKKKMYSGKYIPLWVQAEMNFTNNIDNNNQFIKIWDSNRKNMREKEDISIKNALTNRFHKLIDMGDKYISNKVKVLRVSGIKSCESIVRQFDYASYFKNDNGFIYFMKNNLLLPIYLWKDKDVYKYISDNNIEINELYKKIYIKKKLRNCRVSMCIHEFADIGSIREISPITFDKIVEIFPEAYKFYKQKNLYKVYDVFENDKERMLFLIYAAQKLNYKNIENILDDFINKYLTFQECYYKIAQNDTDVVKSFNRRLKHVLQNKKR